MSLTRALSNANSGLALAGARADVTASNIANASNPNYSAREVISSERAINGQGIGVEITSIERAQDAALTRLRLDADSAVSRSSVMAEAYQTLNSEVGAPGSGYGIFSTIETLEASFRTLQATPESSALQNAVVSAAAETTQELNALSHLSLSMRETADNNIANSVETVNNSLERIQELNREISIVGSFNGAPALKDERQALINQIAEIIPIKEISRDSGRSDITTESGVLLLSGDGTLNELSFTQSPVITETMRYGEAGSTLSGLFVGDQELTPGTDSRLSLQSGSLSAEFTVRDSIATEFSDNLDSIALDLIERFSDDSIDPTKTAGAQGLFTDTNLALDPAQTVGVASTIKINNAVNPNVGGEVYRIRDGMGATSPGNVGNSDIITNMLNAMTENKTASTDSFLDGDHSVISGVAELTSIIGEQSLRFDSINASTTARRDVLKDAEIQVTGVDTDKELQDLLVIEQAYAANARVIQTVSEMIDTLLSLA